MSAKKAPCVDVRTDVHKDVRFEVLGELAGYNRFEALGRMHALWSWCIDRGLQDAPEHMDGYVVSEAVVRRFLGPNGVTAILADGCDEFALGSTEDGMIYLRGTSDYVADRRARAVVASAGGAARAASSRDQGGRFVAVTTNVQPGRQPAPSSKPAVEPAADQPTPASSSSSSPSESQNSLAAHAIPPSTGYDQDSAADRRMLAETTYARIADARDSIAAELGLRSVVPMPRKWGANEPAGFRDLRERIRAEGDVAPQACDTVVEVLTKQAREERDVEWLSDKAFTEGGWRTARNGGMRKRAGPRKSDNAAPGAAAPRTDHPVGTRLVPISEIKTHV